FISASPTPSRPGGRPRAKPSGRPEPYSFFPIASICFCRASIFFCSSPSASLPLSLAGGGVAGLASDSRLEASFPPLPPRQRVERTERLVEEFHVAPAHLLERAERKHAAQRVVDVLAHALLVLGEARHAVLEVFRYERLQRIAVKRDELAQETHRQQIGALGFLFDDDLGQHRTGDVFVG